MAAVMVDLVGVATTTATPLQEAAVGGLAAMPAMVAMEVHRAMEARPLRVVQPLEVEVQVAAMEIGLGIPTYQAVVVVALG